MFQSMEPLNCWNNITKDEYHTKFWGEMLKLSIAKNLSDIYHKQWWNSHITDLDQTSDHVTPGNVWNAESKLEKSVTGSKETKK